jgi:hypothetical protein
MALEWRTIQLFLSDDGVYEVEAATDNYSKMRCTCPAFKSSKKCKHTRHVKKKIETNGGTYAIHLPEDITDEEIQFALDDPDLFRELLIHHAKIEVIG